jgi:two-component system CheB/CheR fusion protein
MEAEANDAAETLAKLPESSQLYVVGIGASSGGVPALQVLLSSMPPMPGFACVIVTHLSPEHESHLAQLLQRYTTMPVTQVTSTMDLQANHVYVIPPNANLEAIDTHVRLSKLEEQRAQRAPIDHFLRTLATARDGTAIGVVLTGTGSDGSLGLRHINQCGGLTVVQDPHEAEFDGMPRSAIATGVVDLVVPLRRMVHEILRFCATRPRLPVPDGNDQVDPREEALLGQLIVDLQKRTHQDFDVFRRATLLKRLRRRMQLQHVTTFKDYLDVLAQKTQEAEALAADLLLIPTEFFEDEAAFHALERRIIPNLFDSKTADNDRLRAWSIGCSTGEEAYSIAILLTEQLAQRSHRVRLQILASDLSAQSLGRAREGIYPLEIATSVSAERLERFFTIEGGSFRVKRQIRDRVLFASHNLFRDPPFAHIDLIVCPNLLKDLQPEVRRAVLGLFHYALNANGILLIENSAERDINGFERLDVESAAIFRKSSRAPPARLASARFDTFALESPRAARQATVIDLKDEFAGIYRSAIEGYTPPSVLINSNNDVAHFSSLASRYVRIPGGELTNDLVRLVPEPLRESLVGGLLKVRAGAPSWDSQSLYVSTDHGLRRVTMHLERVAASELVLVVFDDRDSPASRTELRSDASNIIASLESQIRTLNERLQKALARRDEIEIPRAAFESLHQATEELHSVMEALATAKEELRTVNEEVVALDGENRRRVLELTQISTDLQHLLASTGVATLFLDGELNIARFTPALGELFGLRLSDVGRRISDLTRVVQYRELESDVRRVLADLQPVDREVMSADGHWYLSRTLPYRTQSGHVEGAVLTLTDITARKRAELELQNSSRMKDEFLAVLAHELRNPLAPISAGVEVLKAAPGDRRIVEQMANTLGRQTRQLIRLVDDLLEVSRISGGKLNLHLSTVDLREVVRDAVASASPSVERAGHTLAVQVPGEPLLVDGDAARLVQVVSNLLNNAVRYTSEPGKISVRLAGESDIALLEVSDTGVGVPPDVIENIFEMFYQGRNAHAGRGAGLGIGLTLAKSLVELHGGKISVASAGEHTGSTFSISLPLARATAIPESPAGTSATTPISTAAHRILIVDDNIDAAETLCKLLESLGEQQVHTASSGIEALEKASDLHPDIVLLDLMMPEVDGFEVARRIRSQPWGKDVLLVALSGWGQEEHRRKAREVGFDRHLTKPVELATLQTVLRTGALSEHSYQAAECRSTGLLGSTPDRPTVPATSVSTDVSSGPGG